MHARRASRWSSLWTKGVKASSAPTYPRCPTPRSRRVISAEEVSIGGRFSNCNPIRKEFCGERQFSQNPFPPTCNLRSEQALLREVKHRMEIRPRNLNILPLAGSVLSVTATVNSGAESSEAEADNVSTHEGLCPLLKGTTNSQMTDDAERR